MSERRTSPRRRTIKGGRIVFNDRRSTIDCVIRNQSATGARLAVESAQWLPNEFELVSMPEEKLYLCRIAWRQDDVVGVTFIDPDQ